MQWWWRTEWKYEKKSAVFNLMGILFAALASGGYDVSRIFIFLFYSLLYQQQFLKFSDYNSCRVVNTIYFSVRDLNISSNERPHFQRVIPRVGFSHQSSYCFFVQYIEPTFCKSYGGVAEAVKNSDGPPKNATWTNFAKKKNFQKNFKKG